MTEMTRRRFLAALGAGVTVAAVPKILTSYQPQPNPKPQQQAEPTYTFASDTNTGLWNKTGPTQHQIRIT